MIFGMVNKLVRNKKRGQFASLTWNKELKTLKNVDARVEKVSTAMVRFGVRYNKLKSVTEKYGTDYTPQPLPWGQWYDKEHLYFIEHKDNMYLRCATVKGTKVSTKYYADGVEISKEQAEKMCLASEFVKSGTEMPIFTVKTDNILAIK